VRLYNTLTRRKEEFKPLIGKEVGIYTCGPTVYNYAHIGNMRAYIFADILVRYLRYSGYKVKHVMNITDVGHLTSDSDTGDDKVEKEAKLERKTAWEIADKYTKAFFDDSKALNIKKPDIVVRATDLISEQIDFIQKLEEKGFTYILEDGVYFDTSRLSDYGKLAKLDIEGLRAGERVDIKGKKNKTDFALWKLSPYDKKRDMEWDSPWGKGFPGWHLECSAIGLKYLGEQFDIHTGGIDHINVHHTNEIAQNEALTGKIPARVWMHSEFLLTGNAKMAKSEGNLVRATYLGVDPLAYRMLVLQAHYRDPLKFTENSIISLSVALSNLQARCRNLDMIIKSEELGYGIDEQVDDEKIYSLVKAAKKSFLSAMDNDLNTPQALASLFSLFNEIGEDFYKHRISGKASKAILEFMADADKVLGLGLDVVEKNSISFKVFKLLDNREKARKEKDWAKSDKIRDEIDKLGYVVEDTENGPVIREK
jgi:cysteinyl-tRNA synthetase